jgi:hypothetical protein
MLNFWENLKNLICCGKNCNTKKSKYNLVNKSIKIGNVTFSKEINKNKNVCEISLLNDNYETSSNLINTEFSYLLSDFQILQNYIQSKNYLSYHPNLTYENFIIISKYNYSFT